MDVFGRRERNREGRATQEARCVLPVRFPLLRRCYYQEALNFPGPRPQVHVPSGADEVMVRGHRPGHPLTDRQIS